MRSIFLIPLAVLLLPACQRKVSAPPERPPRPVTAATAEARDVPLYLDEIGSTSAIASVSVRPQVAGRLLESHFQDGAFVKEGDLLFTIDPQPFEAALAQAKATLAQDEARLSFAQEELGRQEELRKTKVITAQEFNAAKNTAVTAAAQVEADRAALEAVQIALDYTRIKSPIDGKTSQRLVDPGNIVAANTTDLVVVKSQDPLHVTFNIAEDQLPRVRRFYEKSGLTAEVSVPAEPNEKRKGEIGFLDNTVRSDTGTVTLRATIKNDDHSFWPGQFVNVRLLLDDLKGAVLIPAESLQVGQQGPFVFVVKDDSTVALRPVTPGQRHEGDVVISDGLTAGERVVVTGQLALAPGAKVVVKEPEQPAEPEPKQ